jgi:outer membrane protein assembly factor BamD
MGGVTSLGVHSVAGYRLRMTARSPFRIAMLAAVAASLTLTAGCASLGRKGPSDTGYVARDAESLYAAAKERLDRGDIRTAAALFDEVERQHPYSVWARRAQLMGAFAYYLRKDYNKSIETAQRFISIHPGNKDTPYAYYLIALDYYEQISDVDRDQKITEQALTALQDVQRRFPNSEYAADANLKIDLVHDHLAGKEMQIGRFYQRTGQWLASELRFQNVVEKYQTTSHTPEALYRLTESSLALGLPSEAKKYAAVLGSNYPGNKWYQRAYKLMREYAPQATAS